MVFENARVIDIGWPRYSESWCCKLSAVKDARNQEHLPNVTSGMLYIANKASPPEPWAFEYVELQNDFVRRALHTLKCGVCFLKRHPKCNVNAAVWARLLSLDKNIVPVPAGRPTFEVLNDAKVIVTAGSSFIPHALWLDKAVLLLPNWARKMNRRFVYEKYCSSFDEDDEVGEFQKKKLVAHRTDLECDFQLGLSSGAYEIELKKKVAPDF